MNKILGYILLGVGLLLIIVPLYLTYQIFTGNSLPPELFKTQKMATTQSNNPVDIQQQQLQKALSSTISPDSISKSFNLASWILLVSILILGGSKIAGLGIQLVKN